MMHQPVDALDSTSEEFDNMIDGLNNFFGGGNCNSSSSGSNKKCDSGCDSGNCQEHIPYTNEPEPKNNQKRVACYWCGKATKKVPGVSTTMWDVCNNSKCKHYNA